MAKISEPAANINIVSRISMGTLVKGEIMSPEDIRIDGTFIGKVKSQHRIIIGEQAMIEGDVICEDAEVWGECHGNFYVKENMILHEPCIVVGDLHVKRLTIETGSQFEGKCSVITEEEFESISDKLNASSSESK